MLKRERYDLVVVGAGLFGATVAHEAAARGKRVLVVDRRRHIGGNCYTRNEDGINVHVYGAHIFRTSRRDIWGYIRGFADFNHYVNSPIAIYHGKVYNLPFNMNTFRQMWNVRTPAEAKAIIERQCGEIKGAPRNLEEQAISLVGRDVYEVLIKEYTEKQWGRPCSELPASIIRRLPVRFVYDNNYFNDPYQGIPIGGYTQIFEKLLANCDVHLGCDWGELRGEWESRGEDSGTKLLYTGPIDEFYDRCFGALEYRSLRFEHERHDETDNLQGNAVVNYTDASVPYTRTIEHKHFEFQCAPSYAGQRTPFTIVSKEYSSEWKPGDEPYYPVNDAKNQSRYEEYAGLAAKEKDVVFGGRLGSYRYYDMHDTIAAALECVKTFLQGR